MSDNPALDALRELVEATGEKGNAERDYQCVTGRWADMALFSPQDSEVWEREAAMVKSAYNRHVDARVNYNTAFDKAVALILEADNA